MELQHINLVDFDQVMFNTREALTLIYKEAFKVHGFTLSHQELLENEGASIDRVLEKKRITKQIGQSIKSYKRTNYHRFFKYIIPNFDVINLPNKVIVSNALSQDILSILQYYNINDVLGVVGREQVEQIKPSPDLYLKAILNFPALNYTVYEDSEAGISAAALAAQLVKKNIAIKKIELSVEVFKGGSGDLIRKQDNYIDKITCSNQSLAYFRSHGIPTPEIIFENNEKLIMRYEEGRSLSETYNHKSHFPKLIELVKHIKSIPRANNESVNSYVERLSNHRVLFKNDTEIDSAFELCISKILLNKELLEEERTFCHGDLTLSNILVRNQDLIIIDPNYYDTLFSTWLLDISKLLQSSRGYEYMFNLTSKDRSSELRKLKVELVGSLDSRLIPIIWVLELSHWLRMLKYKKNISYQSFCKARQVSLSLAEEIKELSISSISLTKK